MPDYPREILVDHRVITRTGSQTFQSAGETFVAPSWLLDALEETGRPIGPSEGLLMLPSELPTPRPPVDDGKLVEEILSAYQEPIVVPDPDEVCWCRPLFPVEAFSVDEESFIAAAARLTRDNPRQYRGAGRK